MITMRPAAEEKIRELMQEENYTIGLRVYVKGGGCLDTSTACRLNPR
jgi:iron-sulfur cluster insertion protein